MLLSVAMLVFESVVFKTCKNICLLIMDMFVCIEASAKDEFTGLNFRSFHTF